MNISDMIGQVLNFVENLFSKLKKTPKLEMEARLKIEARKVADKVLADLDKYPGDTWGRDIEKYSKVYMHPELNYSLMELSDTMRVYGLENLPSIKENSTIKAKFYESIKLKNEEIKMEKLKEKLDLFLKGDKL